MQSPLMRAGWVAPRLRHHAGLLRVADDRKSEPEGKSNLR